MKEGALVCVGSGIKSVGQFTLEAQGWVEQADLVVYCVADPVTEIWIRQNAREHLDLSTLYDNDKERMQTYEEMVEVMVEHVRAGKTVCAVFYGHPGVFVLPSHRAIATLREDGFKTMMLPGISALDCLFADIGVDPATQGCQTVEATDLLLRRRPLLTDAHVVIWQIGCVGDSGFRFAGFDNRNLGVLVDYLLEFYQPSQDVIHYVASQFPVSQPLIERIPLERLLDAQVISLSTLYIPPAIERETVPEMALKLGMSLENHPAAPESPSVSENQSSVERPKSVREIPLKAYRPSKQRSGLADYIADLAQNPQMLMEFNRNPEVASRANASMTEDEYQALLSRRSGRIRIALKSSDDSHLAEGEKPPGSSGNTPPDASALTDKTKKHAVFVDR